MADNSGKRRMSKREEYVKKSLQIQQKQKYAQKQKHNTDSDSKPVQLGDIPYDSNANRQLSKLKLEMDEMKKKIDQMQALIVNPQQTSSFVAEQIQDESLTDSDINDALDDVLKDMKPDEIKQMNDIFDEKSICTTNDNHIVIQQPMQQKTIWLIVSEPITDKITFHVHLMGKNSDVLSSTQFKLFVTQSGFETFSFGIYYAHIEHTQFCTTEYSSKLFTKIKLIKTTSSPFSVETISKTINIESDGSCLFLPKIDNNRKDIHQYILDTTTKETFEKYKKHTYYNNIACAFIPQLITTTNIEITPCTLLGIMVQLYVYLSSHNFNSHIFEIYLLLPSYNIINNWTEASKLLALIGVDMKLKVLASETDIQYNVQDTDDTVLRELFKKITDINTQKFGGIETILDNIQKIYMHDIDQCQNVSFHLQAKYHSIKQCNYLLWYNLLCCVKENMTRNRTVCVSMNPIERDMLAQLREIVELDNRLPKRAFPLVDVWRRKVMIYKGTTFEEFINVIDDTSNIQDTYNFIVQCIQQIKRILGANFGLWIKFIGKIFDLLLQTPYQKLEEFIVSLIEIEFIPNITNYIEDEIFYDFCMSEKYHCMFCKVCV
eukprot:27268_1